MKAWLLWRRVATAITIALVSIPSFVVAQDTTFLGLARPRDVSVLDVRGHEQPRLGQRALAEWSVFHERVVVQPQTAWAQRGQAIVAGGARDLGRLRSTATSMREARAGNAAASTLIPTTMPWTGTMRQAVVLIEFSRDSLQPDSVATSVFPGGGPAAIMDAYWGTGGRRTNWVTVGQFFREASGGRFDVTGELIARVRVSRSMASYMALPPSDRLLTFLNEVGDSLRRQVPPATFERFTEPYLPGRRIVTPLALVHTGVDGACGNTQGFWAHRSVFPPARSFTGNRPTLVEPMPNGAYLGDYILQGARCSVDPTTNDLIGPGIVIHETGHLLGLPDLYNTNTTASGLPFWTGGVGVWDIMSGYSSLAQPSQLGAFHRAVLGWATVREVTLPPAGSAAIDLAPVRFSGDGGGGDTVLALRYGPDPRELLLIEHRTRTGTDRTLPDSGGLLWYVNLARVFDTAQVALPTERYRAPWGPNHLPHSPGLIVLPRSALWPLDSRGRPIIHAATQTDLNRQRTELATAAWGGGTGQGPFGPRTAVPWRSFTTGAAGAGVIESLRWSGRATDPLHVALRRVGALDTLGAVVAQVTPVSPDRPVAGLRWAGGTVALAIPDGIRATWQVIDSASVTGLTMTVHGNGGTLTLGGTVAMTAPPGATVRLQHTLIDGVSQRIDTVAVPLGEVVVRPWTRVVDATQALLGGTMSDDARLFLDTHGNRNGRADLGDLQRLFANRVITP